jgi:hypothetical protein
VDGRLRGHDVGGSASPCLHGHRRWSATSVCCGLIQCRAHPSPTRRKTDIRHHPVMAAQAPSMPRELNSLPRTVPY